MPCKERALNSLWQQPEIKRSQQQTEALEEFFAFSLSLHYPFRHRANKWLELELIYIYSLWINLSIEFWIHCLIVWSIEYQTIQISVSQIP